jgi:hypothetical protein
MPNSEESLVKVVFDVKESEMGISGESLWAAPLEENLYELRNSPWHARNVNWLDIVEATPENDDEWPKFVRVHKRSGHRTIHIYIFAVAKNRSEEILKQCNELGSTYEGMDDHFFALDFPPGVSIEPAIGYFQSEQDAGFLAWRINDYE